MKRLIFLFLTAIASLPALPAATATATLQVIWSDNALGVTQGEAYQKAIDYLHSEDFALSAAQIPNNWKERYANTVGINNYRNLNGLAQQFQQNLQVEGDSERGVITLSLSNPEPDLALYLVKHAANVAVNHSRFKIAEKTDPKVANITQQMETIEDNIQQLRSQMNLNRQMASSPAARPGASIGAPMGIGQAVDPGQMQRRTANSNYQAQISACNQQYQELRRELNTVVNQAWQGKPKAGLVIIDQADLEE